jgi:multiple sugar transport system substrate-binding protein
MKKRILLIIALFFALGLGACGQEAETDVPRMTFLTPISAPPTPEPDVVNPTGRPIPGFVPEKREAVEIEFWHIFGGAQEDALKEILDAFHASQEYVRVNAVYQGDYTRLSEQIMHGDRTGTLPHVSVATPSDVTRYRASRMIIPLSPFMDAPVVGMRPHEMDDIAEAFQSVNIYDGTWYSLPFANSVRLLFYNRDLLNTYGLNAPTNWLEVEQAARMLTDSNTQRVGFGFDRDFDKEWVSMLFQRGGIFIDETSNNAAFVTPEGIHTMGLVMGLLNGPYARFIGADDFGRGRVAMFIGSSSDISRVTHDVGDAFNWGTARIPGTRMPGEGDSHAVEFTGYNLIMLENVSHGIDARVGAWEFMRFTLQPEIAARWAAINNYVPVSRIAVTTAPYRRHYNLNPPSWAIMPTVADGFFRTRVASADTIRAILLEEMEEIRIGNKTIEEGLVRAEERINHLLAST